MPGMIDSMINCCTFVLVVPIVVGVDEATVEDQHDNAFVCLCLMVNIEMAVCGKVKYVWVTY